MNTAKATKRRDDYGDSGLNDEGRLGVSDTEGVFRPGSLANVVRKSGDLWVCVMAVRTCYLSHSMHLSSHRGLHKEGSGLTCPQVVQVYHEASGEVVGVVQGVAEEGGHVEGGQHGGGSQGHGPAAEDHQPHKHEVQKEALRQWPQVGQPVDGHRIDDDVGAVLRQFS